MFFFWLWSHRNRIHPSKLVLVSSVYNITGGVWHHHDNSLVQCNYKITTEIVDGLKIIRNQAQKPITKLKLQKSLNTPLKKVNWTLQVIKNVFMELKKMCIYLSNITDIVNNNHN